MQLQTPQVWNISYKLNLNTEMCARSQSINSELLQTQKLADFWYFIYMCISIYQFTIYIFLYEWNQFNR